MPSIYFEKQSGKRSLGISFTNESMSIDLILFSLMVNKRPFKSLYDHYVRLDCLNEDLITSFAIEDCVYESLSNKMVKVLYDELKENKILKNTQDVDSFSLNNLKISIDNEQTYLTVENEVVFDKECIDLKVIEKAKKDYLKNHERMRKKFERKYSKLKWYHKLFSIRRYNL